MIEARQPRIRMKLEEQARRVARRAPWRVRPGGVAPPDCPPAQHIGAPDFVGVGAQKAGTSWWFSLIIRHPAAFHPQGVHKERHYFNRFWQDDFDAEALRRYAAWFPRPENMITGEWTPRYMADPWTPALLRAAAPDAKLLVLLRDPIERYRSALTHHLRRGAAPTADLAALAAARGLYHQQLSRLLDHFDTKSVLVLQYERCRDELAAQLSRTYDFLGLDSAFSPDRLTEPVGRTPIEKFSLDSDSRRSLVRFFLPDVRKLVADFPDVRASLWPNFRSEL